MLNVSDHDKRWARSHTASKHDNALTKTHITPQSLPRTTISTIPGLEKHNVSHNQLGTLDWKIAELNDKMNIRIEKLETMLREINLKFQKSNI